MKRAENVAIVTLLHAQKNEDLAKWLNVSVRSIYRYREIISRARAKVSQIAEDYLKG